MACLMKIWKTSSTSDISHWLYRPTFHQIAPLHPYLHAPIPTTPSAHPHTTSHSIFLVHIQMFLGFTSHNTFCLYIEYRKISKKFTIFFQKNIFQENILLRTDTPKVSNKKGRAIDLFLSLWSFKILTTRNLK